MKKIKNENKDVVLRNEYKHCTDKYAGAIYINVGVAGSYKYYIAKCVDEEDMINALIGTLEDLVLDTIEDIELKSLQIDEYAKKWEKRLKAIGKTLVSAGEICKQ